MKGKVWLVEAGPGDVGLFTLKGRLVLQQADVVVYDALVGQSILGLIPDAARVIYAGRRSGSHALSQEELSRVLLDEALKGNKVVRLRGGDPLLFGCGGKELEQLAENDIPFEIVPGVTSAFAVPAYNGIPMTHRDCCSSVHIITGHRRGGNGSDIDFDALVRAGGTLVFLMGIDALSDICKGLLHAGLDAETPAAVLEGGTTAAQRRICAPLCDLEKVCGRTEATASAIIVVGQVCGLAESFSWTEKRPLNGAMVILPKTRELSSGMADILREKGAEVLELPVIGDEVVHDSVLLHQAIKLMCSGGYDWIVFTSPSAVRIFYGVLMEVSDLRAFGQIKIAAIGQGTQKALQAIGLKADFLPGSADGETLGTELYRRCVPDARILILRSSIGSAELIQDLERDGRQIDDIPLYHTVYTPARLVDIRDVLERENCYAVFTSASLVKGFAQSVPGSDFQHVRAVCIGPQTGNAAKDLGMQIWISSDATPESLTLELEKAVGGKPPIID